MKKVIFKEEKNGPYDIFFNTALSPLPHLHNNIELILVIDGSAVAHADRNAITLSAGDLFISFPNQVHYYENSTQGEYGIYIFAPDTFFGKKDVIFDNIPKKNVVHLDKDDELYKLFLELLNCKEEQCSETITAGLINLSFGKLLSQIELKPRLKTDNFTLQNILNYCTLNFYSELTLDDVAEALHLSKYYISYLLNNKLAIGFNTYINTLRVNASCDMLVDTDKKIAEIAQESGFNSIRSFNRAFSQVTGMTPSDYRNNISRNR